MEHEADYSFCNPYLIPGEFILWKGRPEKGRLLTGADLIMIPFSIFWLGFALFWEFGAIESGIPFMMLWGLPFIGIGIYLLFGQWIYRAYLRTRTFYVITNKKLILKRARKLTMYTAKDLPPATLDIHPNGNGTITFAENTYYRRGRHYRSYFALENLKDPVNAQNALNQMEI